MSKKMLSQEDVTQVRKIVRDEIHKELKEPKRSINNLEGAVGKLSIAVADLRVGYKEMKEELRAEMTANTDKILTTIDGYMKKTEDFRQEQTIQGAILSKHENIIEKVKQVLK